MIVARHEVPGTAHPKKSRPVGSGMKLCACAHRFEDVREEILKCGIAKQNCGISGARSYRTLRDGSFEDAAQALRAWLRSCCPSVRPSSAQEMSDFW